MSNVRQAGQRSLPIVGVMGSGAEADRGKCWELGVWLAEHEVHLLTGGGAGVMESVSEGFASVTGRAGLVIGILPARQADVASTPPGYPNRFVELSIKTHLPLSGARGTDPSSRNHINVLTSDVVIAMPGSYGTRSEVVLALRYGRPLVGYFDDRAAVPELPETVPLVSDLDALGSWVLSALGRTP